MKTKLVERVWIRKNKKVKHLAKLVSPRNTSKTCSECGYVYKRFKDQRLFHCPKCGLVIDRDLNASTNIARKGMEKFNKQAFLPALKRLSDNY